MLPLLMSLTSLINCNRIFRAVHTVSRSLPPNIINVGPAINGLCILKFNDKPVKEYLMVE